MLWAFQAREHRRPTSPADDTALLALKTAHLPRHHQVDPAFLPDDVLLRLARTQGLEIMPACAILGGLIAQEVLKVLSGRDAPFHNFLALDCLDAEGVVMKLLG